jgi:hypothetical protein
MRTSMWRSKEFGGGHQRRPGTWPRRRRVVFTEEAEDDTPLLLLKRIGMVRWTGFARGLGCY